MVVLLKKRHFESAMCSKSILFLRLSDVLLVLVLSVFVGSVLICNHEGNVLSCILYVTQLSVSYM